MIVLFLFSLSINYFYGWKWYDYAQELSYSSYIKHEIEIKFAGISSELKWEYMNVKDGLGDTPPFVWGGHEHIFTTGVCRSFEFRGIQFEPGLNFGSFTLSFNSYLPLVDTDYFISLILSPSLQIRKEIPKTNLIAGLTFSFYLPIALFKKDLYQNHLFTLYFDLGFKVKK